jgi:hypothetical protein
MKKLHLVLPAAAIALLMGSLAHAGNYPATLVGNWVVTGNHSTGTLSITSQASSPTDNCASISGTIYGDAIQGFYCPGSGRIHFLRKKSLNRTIQAWTGQLSYTNPSQVLRMGGMFSSVDELEGGNLGEYNFNASK